MKKLVALVALAMGSSFAAAEGWNGGIGYSKFQAGFADVSSVDFTLGYEFDTDSNYTNGVDFSLGFGTGGQDDVFFGIDYELERFLSLSYVGKYAFNETVYGNYNIGYANIKDSASLNGVSISDSQSDFVYGIGIGFKTSKNSALELSVRDTGSDLNLRLLSVGLTFDF